MQMVNENLERENKNNKSKFKRKDVNLQYHLYLPFFALIYLGSYLFPLIFFMLYVLLFFKPYFLENSNFFLVFTQLKSVLALLLMPFVIILSYLFHLLFVAILTKICWQFTEKRCPTKNGVILRSVPSDTLNYYHIRSFIIKYGKNLFTKGLFPWLSNWFFNFVGSCKIGKGTTIEEEIVADKFIDVGKNCYIGVNSAICSHTVEGIFGRIPYFEIKIKDDVTCSAFNIVGPGCELNESSYILPLGSFGKNQTTKGDNYYFGLPSRKIFKKKIMEYLQLTEEDLEKDERLRLKKREKEI